MMAGLNQSIDPRTKRVHLPEAVRTVLGTVLFNSFKVTNWVSTMEFFCLILT